MFGRKEPDVPAATPTETLALVADGALLVDVRELNEWDEERVDGAEFKPMSTVNDWYNDLPRDRQIVLMCRTGNRSGQITNALITQAGFDNVLNMTGGIVGWKHAGLDTIS